MRVLLLLFLLASSLAGCSSRSLPDGALEDGLPAGWLAAGDGGIYDVLAWGPCGCTKTAPNGQPTEVDLVAADTPTGRQVLAVSSATLEPLGLFEDGTPIDYPEGWGAFTAWPWLVPEILRLTGQPDEGTVTVLGMTGERTATNGGFRLSFQFETPTLAAHGVQARLEYDFEGGGPVPRTVVERLWSEEGTSSSVLWEGAGLIPVRPSGGQAVWAPFIELQQQPDALGPAETGVMPFSLRTAIGLAAARDPGVRGYLDGHGEARVGEAMRSVDLAVSGQALRRRWDVQVGDLGSTLRFSVTQEVALDGLPTLDPLYSVTSFPPSNQGIPQPGILRPMVVLDDAFAACTAYRGGEPQVFRLLDDGLRMTVGQEVTTLFSRVTCGLWTVEGLVVDPFDGMLRREPA